MTVTSIHRSCPLVPATGISKSPGHLKFPNLNSKLREKICFKYSRFKEKDSNIRIIFGLKNCRIRIRIFEIRGKRFESESNPNIFDHLCQRGPHPGHVHVEVPQLGREAATRPGAEAVQAAQTVLLHWYFTSLQAVLILLSIVNVPYITLILFLC